MANKAISAVKDKTEVTAARDTCQHHWLIEEAQGPTSRGVCKRCGARRDFLNSIPEEVALQPRDKRVLKLPELPDVDFDEAKSRS